MHKIHLLMKRQGKGEHRTVYGQVPNRLPVISMSTHSHDKTVETADNPVYDVLLFFLFVCLFFFVNRFFSCFQESFNTTVSSRYSVCRWIFFFEETTVEPRLFQTCLKYS